MKIFINGGGYQQLVSTFRSLGHEVVHGPAPWMNFINTKRWHEYNKSILPGLVAKEKPDVYLCSKGARGSKFIYPETHKRIRQITKANVYWSQDDPFFIPRFISRGMYAGYDIALSCSSAKFEQYKKFGIDPHVFWPAWDSEVRKQYSYKEEEKTDIIFVGTPYACTDIPRKDILLWAIKQGFSIEIYGSAAWVQDKPVRDSTGGIFIQGDKRLAPYYKGEFRNWQKLPSLFARSKVCISNHVNKARMYLNDRVFLVMGTGGFLVMDHNPGIEKVFKHNKEVCFYENWATFQHRVKHYLARKNAREAIQKNARRKIMTEHTYASRAKQLVSILSKHGVK